MKSLVEAVVIAALITAPLAAFSQTSQPVTRAQVRAELIQLEKAGYNPATSNAYEYPQNIQAAEARVAAEKVAAQNSGYGSSTNGSSQAGSRTDETPTSYSAPVVKYGH